MGVLERREREKQELRQQILETARLMFVREGYDAVTMRKIADAIEYSPTAIYLYFKDKDELMNELCVADFRNLAHEFQEVARIPDPVERLRQTGLRYVEFGLAHPNHYRLMFMTPHPKPSAEAKQHKGDPGEDGYAFLRQTVTECVTAGFFREECTDADALSQLFWAGVHGLVSLHVARGEEDWVEWRPIEKLAQTMIDTLVRGFLRPGLKKPESH